MKSRDYKALHARADELYTRAVNGDREAIDDMSIMLFNELLAGKMRQDRPHLAGSKKGHKKRDLIIAHAIKMLADVMEDSDGDYFQLLIDEVWHKVKNQGIKKRQTVDKIMIDNRALIESGENPDEYRARMKIAAVKRAYKT